MGSSEEMFLDLNITFSHKNALLGFQMIHTEIPTERQLKAVIKL